MKPSQIYHDASEGKQGVKWYAIYSRRRRSGYGNLFRLVNVVSSAEAKDKLVAELIADADAAGKPVEINIQVSTSGLTAEFPAKFDP